MAVYPCDFGQHRYPGPQRSIYVSIASDAKVETIKLRVCQRHFQALGVFIGEKFAVLDDDSQFSQSCEECGAPRVFSAYVKTYDQGAEPVQYATDLCQACLPDILLGLRVASGRPLSER